MARNGTGITIGFGTSNFTAEIMSVNGSGITRPSIDTSHHGSTERTFIPGDLVDNGTVDVEINFDPDEQPPIDEAPETVTITFPTALDNGATLVGSAFVTDWEWGGPLEDKLTASFTLKWAGAVTWTDESSN